jgi:ABC-2 type transport system permease protein
VRLAGRVYAGALLRTGGRTRLREALAAERP